MNPATRFASLLAVSMLAASLSGCVAGPTALKVSRVRYNEAIQKTRKEQLLLNLVRLQYRDEPLFLDVGSVAAQFSFRGSGDVSGRLNEGPPPNPHYLDLGVGFGFEEKPTITLTPLQGKDFAERLLTPLQLDLMALLGRSGWSIDRVLRLTVQEMNGLDNASSASGPTPTAPPRYEKYARVCGLFRRLQKDGLLQIGYEARQSDLVAPLPVENISLLDAVDAVNKGYSLRSSDDGRSLVLTGTSQALVWRIPPAAAGLPEVQELVELLGLAPGRSSYDIQLGIGEQSGPSLAANGRTVITMTTRSLMGALFYLSQAIEVPQEHRDGGLVTTTLCDTGQPFDWTCVTGDLLRVHSRRVRPKGAAVAVEHWGHWYYIDNADLTSKSTLALLGQLFALQAGGAASVAPVLTLPVGS
ncbi:MAG: hypothetical protein JXQ75_04395 [Phycisphaerae bacterium]|nr:hypothetical protein [Phycisphaerae bacterium]